MTGERPPAPDCTEKRAASRRRAAARRRAGADDGTGAPPPPTLPPRATSPGAAALTDNTEVRLVAITSGPRKHAPAAFERRPTVWDAAISRKAFGRQLGPVPGFVPEFVEPCGQAAARASARSSTPATCWMIFS